MEAGFLESGDNYILAIPTASGKTLLGVLAALKTILDGGKVVYTVPLISIQNEKIKEFKNLKEFESRWVNIPPVLDLSVMVFESFDALSRFSWNTLREVDLLIVDEFHMIGEYSRGPTIECAITRSRILSKGMRIIALSATLQNMEELSGWLEARVVEHDYRPVPLHKEVLNMEEFHLKNKNDVILRILKESLDESSQSLVFVSTRRFTESLAGYLAGKIRKNLPDHKQEEFKRVARKILDVPKRRGSLPTAVCMKLAESAENGLVFHHAGLFDQQKDIIEEEFRDGNLLMIIATPSLMYGVNLPSRSVVIRDYTRWTSQGLQPIPVFDYEQMSGRAGRPGYDTEGYSYLIAKTMDEGLDLQERYLHGEVETTNSRLLENKDAIFRQIIAQVASGLAKNPIELTEFFQKTFYGHQNKWQWNIFPFYQLTPWSTNLKMLWKFLLQNGIIQPLQMELRTTESGDVDCPEQLLCADCRALREFARSSVELDIPRLVYEICLTPDLPKVSFKGRKSREPVRERLNRAGVFMVDVRNEEATAAVLMEWMNERSEYEMENAFHVYAAGARRTAYEASLLIKFYREICQVLGIYTGLDQLNVLSARMYYGAREDILPLTVSVRGLGRKRARALVDAFGTDLSYVSRKELLRIEGVGSKTADNIIKHFRRGQDTLL